MNSELREKFLIQDRAYEKNGAYHRRVIRGLEKYINPGNLRYSIGLRLLPEKLDGNLYLDFGGGDAAFATLLANRGAEVTVIDPSIKALSLAAGEDSRLNLVRGRTLLPLPNKSFNCVVMLETLEHIPDEEEKDALKESFRVLKNGGKFLISVPSSNVKVNPKHFRHYSSEDLEDRLNTVGFEIDCFIAFRQIDKFIGIRYADGLFRRFYYLTDHIIRNLNESMGLVECDKNKATDFIVLARKP